MNSTRENSCRPILSVITVTRNAAATLNNCLASVAQQDDLAIEHLVIDGGSTDGTLDTLANWKQHPLYWISEADRGISNAFNKGIALAKGEFIGILNADDIYTAGTLRRAVATLINNPQAGFCFGHCLHREVDGRTWMNLGNPRYFERMRYFMPDVNHPTMIIRKDIYAQVGGYDERWRYAMDYDWLARAEALGIRGILIDDTQAEMAMGGLSDRNWKKSYREARDIAILHGAPVLTAHLDHLGRILKGSLRRTLVILGAHRLEEQIRLFRQRKILS